MPNGAEVRVVSASVIAQLQAQGLQVRLFSNFTIILQGNDHAKYILFNAEYHKSIYFVVVSLSLSFYLIFHIN